MNYHVSRPLEYVAACGRAEDDDLVLSTDQYQNVTCVWCLQSMRYSQGWPVAVQLWAVQKWHEKRLAEHGCCGDSK